MADGNAPPQGAPGCSEELAALAPCGLSGVAEALREEIMADVEARLSQKADSMWKKGQAEFGKLQQDRKEVIASIAELQTSQESLITEQTEMHSALLDIATKMEFVALEMREALRTVGKLEGSSANGGLLPEDALPMPPLPVLPSELMAELSALGFLAQGLEPEGAPPGLMLQGLCTPPRITAQTPWLPAGPSIAPPLPGSPAVLLSLASVLPSAPAGSLISGSPPAGATRLHIADCLELNISSPDKTSAGRTASPVSTRSSLLASGVNGSSSSSPSRADAPSPISGDVVGATFGYDLRLEGLPKSGTLRADAPTWPGTLRADAPTFVPGGSFAS